MLTPAVAARCLGIAAALLVGTQCFARAGGADPGLWERCLSRWETEVSAGRDWVPHPNPDVNEVHTRYFEAARAAQNELEFYRAMVQLVDQLQDGHASLGAPESLDAAWPRGLEARVLGSQVWVRTGRQGRARAGEAGGWSRLRSVDGYAFHAPFAARALLAYGDEPEVVLGLEDEQGEVTQVTLERAEPRRRGFASTPVSGVALRADGSADEDQEQRPDNVYAVRVGPEHDVGYLRLGTSFACSPRPCRPGRACDAAKHISEATQSLLDCRAIILDLQGHQGGSCLDAGACAQWLISPSLDRIPFAHIYRREGARASQSPDRATQRRWPIAPKGSRFTGSLFVVVDGRTCSASEHIAAVLRHSPDVKFVGSPTAGAEFSRREITLEDGSRASFGGIPTTWDNGFESVEGNPITPDIGVDIDEAFLRSNSPRAAEARHRRESLKAAFAAAGLDEQQWAALPDESDQGGGTAARPSHSAAADSFPVRP
jgi:C-terminal processing protease CtpA/Prc